MSNPFVPIGSTSITNFTKENYELTSGYVVPSLTVKRTAVTDSDNNTTVKYTIESRAKFYVSIDVYDTDLVDVTELLLWIKDNLP